MSVWSIAFQEDEPIQAGAEDPNGWRIELFGENPSIGIGIILGKPGPSPTLPGNDLLRELQQKQVSILRVLGVVSQDLKILGGLTIFL